MSHVLTDWQGPRAQYMFKFDYYTQTVAPKLHGKPKLVIWQHFKSRHYSDSLVSRLFEVNPIVQKRMEDMIRPFKDYINEKNFDCDYYLLNNKDVEEHVRRIWKSRVFQATWNHFYHYGQFEQRVYRFECPPVRTRVPSHCVRPVRCPAPVKTPEPETVPAPAPDDNSSQGRNDDNQTEQVLLNIKEEIEAIKRQIKSDPSIIVRLNDLEDHLKSVVDKVQRLNPYQLHDKITHLETCLQELKACSKQSFPELCKLASKHELDLMSLKIDQLNDKINLNRMECLNNYKGESSYNFRFTSLENDLAKLRRELSLVSNQTSAIDVLSQQIKQLQNKILTINQVSNVTNLDQETIISMVQSAVGSHSCTFDNQDLILEGTMCLVIDGLTPSNISSHYLQSKKTMQLWANVTDRFTINGLCGTIIVGDSPHQAKLLYGTISLYNRDLKVIYQGTVCQEDQMLRYYLANLPTVPMKISQQMIIQICLVFVDS